MLTELGGVSRRTFYRWREIGAAPNGIGLPNGETSRLAERARGLARKPPGGGVNTSDVKFWDVRRNKSEQDRIVRSAMDRRRAKPSPYAPHQGSRRDYLSDLRQAAKRGGRLSTPIRAYPNQCS